MSATLTYLADDIIDAMLTRSGGETLRAPRDLESGEYDGWRQGFSRRDIRRVVGAQLITANGCAADQLLQMFDGCHDMNADEFCVWWIREALRGLDQRAARRAGAEVDEFDRPEEDWPVDEPRSADTISLLVELTGCADVPAWFHDWCGRLIHEPKLALLVEMGAARWCGYPPANLPGRPWAHKLARQFERRAS